MFHDPIIQLVPGVWRWTAYHLEWKSEVSSFAYSDGTELVLIDPLLPADRSGRRRFWKTLDTEVRGRATPIHVVLTIHWHERHAPEIAARYASSPGAALWVPSGAASQLSWPPDHAFVVGDRLPAGIVAFDTLRDDEVVLWLPAANAIVCGDVLLGGKRKPLRVCPQSWLPPEVKRAELADSLASLLELPVELILPAHGEPIQADAAAVLERALADAA